MLTYVEVPPLRGIYLPLAEVLFTDGLFYFVYTRLCCDSVSCHHCGCHYHHQRRRHCYDHYHVALTVGEQIFQKVLETISQFFNFNLTTLGSNPRKPSNQIC